MALSGCAARLTSSQQIGAQQYVQADQRGGVALRHAGRGHGGRLRARCRRRTTPSSPTSTRPSSPPTRRRGGRSTPGHVDGLVYATTPSGQQVLAAAMYILPSTVTQGPDALRRARAVAPSHGGVRHGDDHAHHAAGHQRLPAVRRPGPDPSPRPTCPWCGRSPWPAVRWPSSRPTSRSSRRPSCRPPPGVRHAVEAGRKGRHERPTMAAMRPTLKQRDEAGRPGSSLRMTSAAPTRSVPWCTMLDRLLQWARIDFDPGHRPPEWWRLALATVLSVVLTLAADAALVAVGTKMFPATKGYSHFQFHDYAKLTIIGVLIACAAWPVVARVCCRAALALLPLGHRRDPRPASCPISTSGSKGSRPTRWRCWWSCISPSPSSPTTCWSTWPRSDPSGVGRSSTSRPDRRLQAVLRRVQRPRGAGRVQRPRGAGRVQRGATASTRASISSLRLQPPAATFAATCSGLVAPAMTDATAGRESSQAKARSSTL